MKASGAQVSAPGAAVLVPVKAFGEAKIRLAPVLSPADRIELARNMATHVVRAAAPLPVAVVCDDTDVADWAVALGAAVVWCPGTGLNGAVARGVKDLAARGTAEVIVAHSDLPGARGFAHLAGAGGVTLVPDRRADGTNVLCVPAGAGFEFSYGAGSFRRHRAEARRLHLAVRVRHDPDLNWDVDLPADLARLRAAPDQPDLLVTTGVGGTVDGSGSGDTDPNANGAGEPRVPLPASVEAALAGELDPAVTGSAMMPRPVGESSAPPDELDPVVTG